MKPTSIALLAAPVLFAVYGVVRLIGRSDGHYGPGLDWQAAHLSFLAGLVLLGVGLAGMVRQLPATGPRRLWTALASIGLVTSVVQIGVDIVAGLLATDHANLSEITGRFTHLPGAEPVFYQAGPPLLYIGLTALSVLLARRGRMAWWNPVLIGVGSILPMASLNLLPLSGALLLAGLAPLALRKTEAGAAAAV
ncbi:hypothetical protein ORV05_27130 [Amycolatopsis cynarae]|uniref:Uncharacterized protein n=1 Tax=Amycolatopsis cynarae TaxID=2995223 RepID=A0ABY7AY23_9PSEU|nr:hypothetical protein [Amycolatopsis sp. HUAS 11-8]WAL64610.1 hypothetical protein ORV05_27130 [Amycolatopsis sp. HUAS 11-8]